jgi:predicted nucleotidyltransferase
MIEKLIKKTAKQLDQQKIPYMIIGGQAVLVYGRPRLTRDIDITLGVDTDRFDSIEGVCKKLKLRILVENPEDFARDTKVLPAEEPDSKVRIDFIFSFTQYEAQAIKNAKRILVDDYQVKFASCEDVIIHKMVAGRAIDEEDVKSILIKNKDTVDLEYIKKWLSGFCNITGHGNILKRFNNLLKKVI